MEGGFLDVAVVFASSFDKFGELVFEGVQNKIVGGGVFKFCAAKTAFEFTDAVEAVGSFVLTDDAP